MLLESHFTLEREAILPHIGDGSEALHAEHEKIMAIMDRLIESSIHGGSPNDQRIVGLLDELQSIIREHIWREERILIDMFIKVRGRI